MKKLLFSFFAMSALLLTSSCSNETDDIQTGKTSKQVSFQVQLPTGISDKVQKSVYADGTTATTLSYKVYEVNGDATVHVSALDGTATINSTATVSLSLITGKTYKIVFWAQNSAAPYTLGEDGTVTVDYSAIKSNDETQDAFYRCYTYKAGDAVENPVKLYRPFAQLNVGTKDVAAAVTAGFAKDNAQTEVTVSGIANKLDLLTGEVSGSESVTYKLNAIPTGQTFPKAGYDYLSMNYLLVGKEAKSTVDVSWKITDQGSNTVERTFANTPVQGNYRTNIYGNLLTSTTDFNVEIDPAFSDPDYVKEVKGVKVATQEELNAAVLTEDATVILPANDTLTMPTTVAEGVTFVGEEGSVIEQNTAVAYHGKSVTFENLTLKNSNDNYIGIQHAAAVKFVGCTIEGKPTMYATDAEFEKCTFKQTTYEYCIWTYGSTTLTFNNCIFDCVGKAVKVYKEAWGGAQVATFNNCSFIATNIPTGKGKAAIEIDSRILSDEASFEVNLNNCTETGFVAGEISGNTLWNVEGSKATVYVNGTQAN